MRPGLHLSQRGDDISQRGEGLINLFTFFETLARSTCDADAFTTRQIDQVKFSYFDLLGAVHGFFFLLCVHGHLLHDDDEDGVTATRQIVHFGGGCCSRGRPLGHQTVDLVGASHGPLTEPFNKHPLLAVLTDLQTSPIHLQKVRYVFVVDLQVRCTHHKSHVLVALHLNEGEYLLHRPWHYTSLWVARRIPEPLHSMCLTRACLPIREDCRIIPLQYRLHHGSGGIRVDEFLGAVGPVDVVEGKGLPNRQVRVLVDVPRAFSLVDFRSQVLHDCARATVG